MQNTNTLAVEMTITPAVIQEWLIQNLSKSLELSPTEIDVREPFASYGLSSVASVSLTADLEDWLGLKLLPTLAWDYPSIEMLSLYLSDELQQQNLTAVSN